jgi:hypothetical protein
MVDGYDDEVPLFTGWVDSAEMQTGGRYRKIAAYDALYKHAKDNVSEWYKNLFSATEKTEYKGEWGATGKYSSDDVVLYDGAYYQYKFSPTDQFTVTDYDDSGEEVDTVYNVSDYISGKNPEEILEDAYVSNYIQELEVYNPYNYGYVSMREFRNSLFKYVGIEQGSAELLNDNVLITKTIDSNEITFSDCVQVICQANACFGHMDEYGVFQYVYIGSETVDYTGNYKASQTNYSESQISPIDSVRLYNNAGEPVAIYGAGDNYWSLPDNFLLYNLSDDVLQAAAKKLYEYVNGIVYTPTTLAAIFSLPVEIGSKMTFTSYTGEVISFYALQDTLSGVQMISQSITANGNSLRDQSVSADTAITQLESKTDAIVEKIYEKITADSGEIKTLYGDLANYKVIVAGKIQAQQGDFEILSAKQADFENATAENFNATNANIDFISGDLADYKEVVAAKIEAVSGEFDTLDTKYATVDFANVKDGSITTAMIGTGVVGTAQIADGSITDAKIVELTASKLTAGTIDAADIEVINLNAANITVGTINGQQIASGAIDMSKLSEGLSGTIVSTQEDVEKALRDAQTANNGLSDLSVDVSGFRADYDNFVGTTNDTLDSLQDQIDGAIETFTGSEVPTLNNIPASNWTTDDELKKHVGDLYIVNADGGNYAGFIYRFMWEEDTGYYWTYVPDSEVTKALKDAADAQTAANAVAADLKEKTDAINEQISSTKDDLKDVSDSLGKVTDRVTITETDIGDLKTTISEQSKEIESKADGSTVTSLSSAVSQHTQDISGLSSRVSSAESTLTSKADGKTVTAVSNRVGALESSVSEFEASLKETNQTVSNNYDSLKGNIDEVDTKFSSYSTTTEVESKIAASKESILLSVSDTYSTKTSLGELDTRVSTAELKIKDDAIVSTVRKSEAYINDLSGKVSATEIISQINQTAEAVQIDASRINLTGAVTISSMSSDVINTIKGYSTDAVNAIEIGGENLVSNSESFSINARKNASLTFEKNIIVNDWMCNNAVRAYGICGTSTVFATYYNPARSSYKVYKAGQTYTLSIYIKNNSSTNSLIIAPNTVSAGDSIRIGPGENKRAVITYPGQSGNNVQINFAVPEIGSEVDFTYWRLKIEEGNKVTDWTPAPEDVDASISTNSIANWCYNNDLTYINGGKIYAGTVTATQIAASAITTDKLAANAVTAVEINVSELSAISSNVGTITSGIIKSSNYKYTSGAYSDAGTYIGLGTGTIITPNFTVDGTGNVALSGTVIATAGTIGGCVIKDGALVVSNANIANGLDASKITTGLLSANRIASISDEDGNTVITGGKIVADSITAKSLRLDDILSNGLIASNRITAKNINITDGLSSISADIGTVTSGVIQSKNYAYSSGNFSKAGTLLDLSSGVFRSKNFGIDIDGNTYIKGAVNALTGVIGGLEIKDSALYSSKEWNEQSPSTNETAKFTSEVMLSPFSTTQTDDYDYAIKVTMSESGYRDGDPYTYTSTVGLNQYAMLYFEDNTGDFSYKSNLSSTELSITSSADLEYVSKLTAESLILQSETERTYIDSSEVRTPRLDVGAINASGEVISTSPNAFRAVCGDYGFIIRNDNYAAYFMSTNSGDPYGSWNANYSYIELGTGNWHLNRAVYLLNSISANTTAKPNTYISSEGIIAKSSTTSSRRFKVDITSDIPEELNPELLYDVSVVSFKYKKDHFTNKEDIRYQRDMIGLIAEDVYDKYPIAADYHYDDAGEVVCDGWNDQYLIPAMLKLIQDQKKEIDAVRKELQALQAATA